MHNVHYVHYVHYMHYMHAWLFLLHIECFSKMGWSSSPLFMERMSSEVEGTLSARDHKAIPSFARGFAAPVERPWSVGIAEECIH